MLHWALWLSSHCRFGTPIRTPSDPWGCFRVFFFSEVFVKWRGFSWVLCGQVAVEMFKIYQLMWERNIWKKWTWGSTKIQQYSRNSGLSVNQISKHIQSEMRDFLSCSGEMSFWLKAAVKWKTWIFEGSKTTGPAYDSSQSTVLWRLDWFFFYWKIREPHFTFEIQIAPQFFTGKMKKISTIRYWDFLSNLLESFSQFRSSDNNLI